MVDNGFKLTSTIRGFETTSTAAILDTLKHPIRLEIIFLLSQSPATFEMIAKEIARTLSETNKNVIKGHIAVLRFYGAIKRENGIYYLSEKLQQHEVVQAIVQYIFKERKEITFEHMVFP